MISFSLDPKDEALALKVETFVRETVIPFETDPRKTSHGPTEELRLELTSLARQAGVLATHVAPEFGGMGLNQLQRAIVFEAAGYSPLGPIAVHCSAPDEGNMHMLELIGSEAQKHKYLKPLASARTRSCFAMTEPEGGAGSDPSLLATKAVGDGKRFVVNGKKWLITGFGGATMVNGQDVGATMFMVDLPNPAVVEVRMIDSMDSTFTGGHAELDIKDLVVTDQDILGEIGKGFRYAQVRLAPARLTHCMRWLGAARRAQDIALDYARKRQSFGKPLGEHQGVGFMLADNDMDLHLARLVTREAAWQLDQGHKGNMESSRAKVMVSEALYRVGDRCVQILGGAGLTNDTRVSQIFRDLRAFRVYDGPSEVHRFSLARRLLTGK
jgi:acyl-CoA dehydrogenase